MIQIRKGFFETNSSSTHSIALGDTDKMTICTSLRPDIDGTVHIEGYEFGWEEETYWEAVYKASYAWLIVRDWSEPAHIFNPDSKSKEARLEMLINVIKKQTGCHRVEFEKEDGYIDHQSAESDECGWLFDSEEVLHNFIFNRHSILETDNDNH